MAGTAVFRRLHQLADRAEPSLRNAYIEAIEAVRNATSAIRLAAAIERGDIRVVDRILSEAGIERELRRATEAIRRLTLEAARLERLSLGLSGSLTQVNPRAVQAAEQQAAKFVTRVSGETKKAIRAIVAQSVGGELTPLEAAERIRPLIGLTSQQARAVVNLRRSLLARGAKDIDAKVQRYSAKLLRLRARTIARTETIAAANRGQQAIWEAAKADGLLPPDVKRRWITTPDDRLCPQCQAVGGQVVGLNQPFVTPLGLVMTPPLHPNCRCAIALDVASLALARGTRQSAAA